MARPHAMNWIAALLAVVGTVGLHEEGGTMHRLATFGTEVLHKVGTTTLGRVRAGKAVPLKVDGTALPRAVAAGAATGIGVHRGRHPRDRCPPSEALMIAAVTPAA